MARRSLSRKVRFEVFKRDHFTCQYCGAQAPDVVLQADHVDPVAHGGSDSLLNLVTSCAACNGGKGATKLDDHSAVEKQRRQVEQLQERREQIDMMVEWQKGLSNLDDYATEQAAKYWDSLTPGWSTNDVGRKMLRKVLRRFSLEEVMVSMRIAAESYIRTAGDPPVCVKDSVELAFGKIGGVCAARDEERRRPHIRRLYWIRGIIRRRWTYVKEHQVLAEMEEALRRGVSLDDLERLAKGTTYWTQWRSRLDELIELAESEVE